MLKQMVCAILFGGYLVSLWGRSINPIIEWEMSSLCFIAYLLPVSLLFVWKFETETITGLITFCHSLPPPYIRVAIHEWTDIYTQNVNTLTVNCKKYGIGLCLA